MAFKTFVSKKISFELGLAREESFRMISEQDGKKSLDKKCRSLENNDIIYGPWVFSGRGLIYVISISTKVPCWECTAIYSACSSIANRFNLILTTKSILPFFIKNIQVWFKPGSFVEKTRTRRFNSICLLINQKLSGTFIRKVDDYVYFTSAARSREMER